MKMDVMTLSNLWIVPTGYSTNWECDDSIFIYPNARYCNEWTIAMERPTMKKV